MKAIKAAAVQAASVSLDLDPGDGVSCCRLTDIARPDFRMR
jgi:hypothetical protein